MMVTLIVLALLMSQHYAEQSMQYGMKIIFTVRIKATLHTAFRPDNYVMAITIVNMAMTKNFVIKIEHLTDILIFVGRLTHQRFL
jgi:hypothetical protein